MNAFMPFAFALLMAFSMMAPSVALKTESEDALGLGLDAGSEPRPVMKVVMLLQDMKKQLETELDDDKEVHNKMMCWCETTKIEKTNSIDDGTEAIAQLKSSISEAKAQITEAQTMLKKAKADLASDRKALDAATTLRMKEHKEFTEDQDDLVDAVEMSKDAITVLSDGPKTASLLDIRRIASKLQAAKLMDMETLDNLKKVQLTNFFNHVSSAKSFLSIPGLPPRFRGSSFLAGPDSDGPVLGILKQMHHDFSDDLEDLRRDESDAVKKYDALKAAKVEQLSGNKKTIVELDMRLGSLIAKKAEDSENLKNTITQVDDDSDILSKAEKKCKDLDDEYNTRVKDRFAEMEAVEEAITILNNEDSFNLFDKTLATSPSLLQVSSSTAEREQLRRQAAIATLERASVVADSPWLALIAGRVRLDSFTKVKKAISQMLTQLTKQQKDEIDHKDWCTMELFENTAETNAANDKKDNLDVKTDNLKMAKDTLKKDIATSKTMVSDIELQMKQASANREAENADYQEIITDQRMTQTVLSKAIARMKEVYALLQSERRHRHGRHRRHRHRHAQPAGAEAEEIAAAEAEAEADITPAEFDKDVDFKKYDKNAGGAKVILMLEKIVGTSKAAEADALKANEDAEQTYEIFMKGSNKALKAAANKLSTQSGYLAKTEEELVYTRRDHSSTVKKLENLSSEKDDLHKSCDFILKNFKVRQGARAAEMDALKEAMSILSGGK